MANVSAELIWGLTQHHVSTSPHYCAYYSLLHHVLPAACSLARSRVYSCLPQNAFLIKQGSGRIQFSREKGNLLNKNSFRSSGLANAKAVHIGAPTGLSAPFAVKSGLKFQNSALKSKVRARLIPHVFSHACIFRKALATCTCLALVCPLTCTPLGCQRRREEPGQGQEGRSQGCRQHCFQEEQRHPQRKAPEGRQQGLHQDRPPRPPGQRIGTLLEGARSPRADQQARRSASVSAWQERSWCRSRGLPREPRQLFKGQAHSEEARAGTFPQTHDAPARNSPAARLRRFLNCCKSLFLFKPARIL